MSQPTHVSFETLGIPVPQGSKRAFIQRGRALMVESNADRLALWRNDVVASARRARKSLAVITGPVFVEMVFTFPRPKSHFGTGANAHVLKRSAPHHHVITPDLDKLVRAVGDALTIAKVIDDDKQIVSTHASKHWRCGYQLPGVIVTVTRVDAVDAAGVGG